MAKGNKINLDFLKKEVGDEPEFISGILKVFSGAMSEFLQQTSVSLEVGDYTAVATQSHKLAPSCLMLGLKGLHDQLKHIEQKVMDNETQGMPNLIKEVEVQIKALLVELEQKSFN